MQANWKKLFNKTTLMTLFLLPFLLTLAEASLSAQEHLATLDGLVMEENGNPLPGVLVEVINENTGVRYQAISNENGRYVVSGINPGTVRVQAKIEGFETRAYTGVILNVGTRKSLNLEMKLGEIKETVSVTADVPIVEVTKSEVSSVVDRGTIESMPLLDRDFTSLTLTKPGAVSSPAGGLVTNALPRGTNEMLIDGVSNEETINNFNKASVPADAIQEFKVITNSFAAEYGNASGMLQSAITRSGTNDIVGGVSYYNRTEALGDVNYFLNHDGYEGKELSKEQYEKPKYKINRFAANFGGPIVKNKAHFFLAYEGLLSETYGLVNTPLEPTQGAFTRTIPFVSPMPGAVGVPIHIPPWGILIPMCSTSTSTGPCSPPTAPSMNSASFLPRLRTVTTVPIIPTVMQFIAPVLAMAKMNGIPRTPPMIAMRSPTTSPSLPITTPSRWVLHMQIYRKKPWSICTIPAFTNFKQTHPLMQQI